MENIATKKFSYDHLSSYKTRGKLGASNRNVRVQRANENRHLSRMDEVSKRRRMPLSPLDDENVIDTINGEKATKDDDQRENDFQPELSRREKLLKWREERMKNKGTEPQKKSFVVRHIEHDNDAGFFATAINKATKGVVPLIKPSQFSANKPAKPATRASARIAKQASANLTAEPKSRTVKKVESKSKAANIDKVKEKAEVKPEKTGRVTRQNLRTKASLVGKAQPSKVTPEPKSQIKTRSQAKKLKDKPPKETCLSKHEENEKQKEQTLPPKEDTSDTEQANFPAVDAIKNTVSFGRGSTEGVERFQSSVGSRTEAPSFAPADFKFTAPNGVNTFTYLSKTFKFQPLSPNSAAEFMFPSSTSSFFSPTKPAEKPVDNLISEDPMAAFNKSVTSANIDQQQSENSDAESLTVPCEVAMETCNEEEKQQSINEVVDNESTMEITETQQQPVEVVGGTVTAMESDVPVSQDTGDEEHDAAYFRNLVKMETDRLNEVCAKWEKISAEEENLSEEVTGQIRTSIGQAQLLIDQRFRQFSGLIDLSEDKNAEKRATASDLQGFWEMIYFQIEDVSAKFDALAKLKENNWKEEEKKARKVSRKAKTKKPVASVDAKASNKLVSTRNKIQEMRMAMKAKMAADKEKLKAEKWHQEEEAFVTILTPMKKSKKDDGSDNEVVLTPVRRSTRKTPLNRSVHKNTPVVVTTPKVISEDSPGLRLTPDNAHLPTELVTMETVMDTEETREEAARGETYEKDACSEDSEEATRGESGEESCEPEMDFQQKDDEMECDFGQHTAVALKSACKSANSNSRTFSVTFQSPAELGDQQSTPECTGHEIITPPVDPPAVCSPVEISVPRRKKGTPQRFMARKCRGRVSTPYYQDRPRRRVSSLAESDAVESESQSSGDSDSSDAKDEEHCPGSGLRQSLRRTPSKYRDSNPLLVEADEGGKIPAEVSVKLFHATGETPASEAPTHDSEQDAFTKYLCPSSDDECSKEPLEHTAENVFEKEETTKDKDPVDDEKHVTLTPPEETQNVAKPLQQNSASKTGRTPIHLLRYLSDMDTPSPNSRQITPMPKTTIFVSPPVCSKTPTLAESLGTMSPENDVRQIPAQNDGSLLFSLGGVAGKTSQGSVTPSSQLAAFHLDSPVNNEKRRDSVFFAPPSTADAVRLHENLMSFSPVVERSDEEQE